MTTKLLAATGNPGKLREFRAILEDIDLDVVSPDDIGLEIEVEETGSTFEENARLKAIGYSDASGLPALADDSGIEVDALDGYPGVASARWVEGSDDDRLQALLRLLEGIPPVARTARFRAVAALSLPNGTIVTAEGTIEGRIGLEPRGDGGFGYDPVFLVEDGGYTGDLTSAELPAAEKNRLSHRGRAVRELLPELQALVDGKRE